MFKRSVKKQQMRWTPEGARFLLQIRIEVLNGNWRATLPELTRRLKQPTLNDGGRFRRRVGDANGYPP
jgi:hypothetical protein